MKSITASKSALLRRVFAAVLVTLFLLSTSCAKKAALMSTPAALYSSSRNRGGGGGGGLSVDAVPNAPASSSQSDAPAIRKVIRNGSLDLLVNDVGQSIDKIGSLANAAGGFV